MIVLSPMGKKMIFYFCFNKFKLNSDLYPGAIVLDTADIERFLLLKNYKNNNTQNHGSLMRVLGIMQAWASAS